MSQAVVSSPFILLRWFAINSFVAVATVCAVFALITSRYFVADTVARDAIHTAQFIQAIAETETRAAQIDGSSALTMGQVLDFRPPSGTEGVSVAALERARTDFYKHIARLPDALLIKVFSAGGVVVWSTEPTLVGQPVGRYARLVDALDAEAKSASGAIQTSSSDDEESRFLGAPQKPYVENYIPLLDRDGNVVLVIEVDKAPASLFRTLEKGRRLIWGSVMLVGVVIYLLLFWFACHMALQFSRQQGAPGNAANARSV